MSKYEFVKSSYSTGNGECVEVARNVSGTVAVRDSKILNGPVLRLAPTAWSAFTEDLPALSRRR
ncbi:DUF397 domain-containing protein [Streptomyces sp. O3]